MDFAASLRPYYPEKEIDALLNAMRQNRDYGFYLNTGRLQDETILSALPTLRAHPEVPHAYLFDETLPLGKSLLHNAGAFYILDPASMLAPYYLNPAPGERILDLCAAPGGKTVMLSLLLQGSGVILSNDLSYPRALTLSSNVERMGLDNVAVVSGDFSKAYRAYESYFDAILLDAPCSGSAMFRKDARLMEDWSIEKVHRCAATQAELLEIASFMLREGGRLLYSTCSFSYEEDEGSVLSFLRTHAEFEAVKLPQNPAFFVHADLPEAIHLFPHRHPGEGQFIALLRKKGDAPRIQTPVHRADEATKRLYASFGLQGRDNVCLRDTYWSLSQPVRIEGVSLIRYGVKLGEKAEHFLPDHALAVYGGLRTIDADEARAKRYLAGETFPCDEKDGDYAVSYFGLNLGLVRVRKGVAKNHLPKGLRRRY